MGRRIPNRCTKCGETNQKRFYKNYGSTCMNCHKKAVQERTHRKSPERRAWELMITRHRSGKYAGMELHRSWWSFEQFLRDMPGCKEGDMLWRIDKSKGYFPGNCCWKPKRLILKVGQIEKTLYEWAEESGLRPNTIYQRCYVRGWSAEAAVYTPTHKKVKND